MSARVVSDGAQPCYVQGNPMQVQAVAARSGLPHYLGTQVVHVPQGRLLRVGGLEVKVVNFKCHAPPSVCGFCPLENNRRIVLRRWSSQEPMGNCSVWCHSDSLTPSERSEESMSHGRDPSLRSG